MGFLMGFPFSHGFSYGFPMDFLWISPLFSSLFLCQPFSRRRQDPVDLDSIPGPDATATGSRGHGVFFFSFSMGLLLKMVIHSWFMDDLPIELVIYRWFIDDL